MRSLRRLHIGEERYVVSMFVDMRGSTKLSEVRLPFDVVVPHQPLRRGGLASRSATPAASRTSSSATACWRCSASTPTAPPPAGRRLRAASLVAANVAYLNHQFGAEVREPIEYGIGIHAGDVIVGDIGFRGHTVFTALGDAVNVAARLQDMTKTLNCKVVASEEVWRNAGLATDALPRTEVAIRGHDEKLTVCTADDPTVIGSLIEPQPEPEPETAEIS